MSISISVHLAVNICLTANKDKSCQMVIILRFYCFNFSEKHEHSTGYASACWKLPQWGIYCIIRHIATIRKALTARACRLSQKIKKYIPRKCKKKCKGSMIWVHLRRRTCIKMRLESVIDDLQLKIFLGEHSHKTSLPTSHPLRSIY